MKLQTQDIRIAIFTTDAYKEIISVLSLHCFILRGSYFFFFFFSIETTMRIKVKYIA